MTRSPPDESPPRSVTATGLVDMAGNAQLRAEIHHHFGGALTFSISVGDSLGSGRGRPCSSPGGEAGFFFARASEQNGSKIGVPPNSTLGSIERTEALVAQP